MLPLGELVENTEQVDTTEAVSPAVGGGVTDLQGLGCQLRLLTNHTGWEVEECNAEAQKINKTQ